MEAGFPRILLVACLLAGPLAGCIGQDGAPSEPASQQARALASIGFEKIHHPDEIVEIVDELDKLPAVSTERIGTSLEGRAIQMVSLGDGDLELWIVGRQHGNEPTGAEAILLAIEALGNPEAQLPATAPAILQTFHEHRETLLERLTLHFVPVGNPDGAAAYQRGTATGQDPNRDHFAFTHPFSRALREAFWDVQPDACLDLHNEGIGSTDFDAFGPEGPMMEAEPYDRMRTDASLAVREVDAAGANAGAFNENYRSPPPADDRPNPTAFHPGTHDMFCTTRGAPGWTPEGAIEGGGNGATDDVFAWSTRLHEVTIAAHALHWAGIYDASQMNVWKASGVVEPTIEHTYELEEPGSLTLQTVWRQTATVGDHNLLPARFTVTTPSGQVHEGRMPHTEAWTSTVLLEDAKPGSYELSLTGAPAATYEMRAYAQPERPALVTLERTEQGMRLSASPQAQGSVEVRLSDVFDPAEVNASAFEPAAETLRIENGTVGQRQIAEWTLALDPGTRLTIEQPEDVDARGPYRFTASDEARLQTGVENALNPQAN